MSLLEDVFLENEADEAQELERIIEGDEFDERPRSRTDSDENSAKEDEAEEDKRRVDPTNAKPKRVIKNPRFVLNPARLTGPRGIQVLPEHFKDFKFKGKGHESEDLDLVLKKLEHWAYRLYPKFAFQDCLRKIETLGKKKAVSVHLTKIRMDLITSDETVTQRDSSDDEAAPVQEPEDEFDKLLQQQIDIARATPNSKNTPFGDRTSMLPKATSSPSINDEQRERMLRNRRMAEERRQRKKLNTSQENPIENSSVKSPTTIDDISIEKKHQSAIDNSDDVMTNKSVTTDIHYSNKRDIGNKGLTVELDSDGTAVTRSTKSCVPAKKNNRSSIDGTQDDGVMNKGGTFEIDTVELDNDGIVVTKFSKTYVPAKKHNISRIDSSDADDSDAPVISEPVTVDVEKHHNDISTRFKNKANKNNKFNVMDSSDDDDDLVMNEPVTVEVENHRDNVISSKHNKPNVIDSSEDEDEAMNESITVDIHDSSKNDTSSLNRPDTNKNDSVFDSLRTANTVYENFGNKHDTISSSNRPDINKNDSIFDSLRTANTVEENVTNNEDSDDTEKQDTGQNKLSCGNVSNGKDNQELPDNIAEKAANNVCETNSEVRNQENDENVSEVENIDEIMDVDFGDDF